VFSCPEIHGATARSGKKKAELMAFLSVCARGSFKFLMFHQQLISISSQPGNEVIKLILQACR